MKLNDAVLKIMAVDGVEYSTMREFNQALLRSKSLSMDVYVNTKLVCSGRATVLVDNHWMIASTTAQLSFTDPVQVQAIVARVRQGETVIYESVTTDCGTIITSNDVLASFYVCLGTSSPNNELTKRVPDTKFAPRAVDRIPDTVFDDIETEINALTDVTIDDSDEDGTGGTEDAGTGTGEDSGD